MSSYADLLLGIAQGPMELGVTVRCHHCEMVGLCTKRTAGEWAARHVCPKPLEPAIARAFAATPGPFPQRVVAAVRLGLRQADPSYG